MAWDMPQDMKHKLFWDNALRFYRLFKPAATVATGPAATA